MKNQMKALFAAVVLISSIKSFSQDISQFKLFEKSTVQTGFGGVTFNLLTADYFLLGGEGAAVWGNYYFGGFGFSGNIGNYSFPLSFNEYRIQRNSGGLVVGAVSNSEQIFALYTSMRLSFDQYQGTPTNSTINLQSIAYRSISLIPQVGVTLRPLSFLQLRLGAGYSYSGLIDDGGLENVPYRAPIFNFDITFGGF